MCPETVSNDVNMKGTQLLPWFRTSRLSDRLRYLSPHQCCALAEKFWDVIVVDVELREKYLVLF